MSTMLAGKDKPASQRSNDRSLLNRLCEIAGQVAPDLAGMPIEDIIMELGARAKQPHNPGRFICQYFDGKPAFILVKGHPSRSEIDEFVRHGGDSCPELRGLPIFHGDIEIKERFWEEIAGKHCERIGELARENNDLLAMVKRLELANEKLERKLKEKK